MTKVGKMWEYDDYLFLKNLKMIIMSMLLLPKCMNHIIMCHRLTAGSVMQQRYATATEARVVF